MTAGNEESNLATRLRLAREAAGLKQKQVADLMTMHRPTVTEIEAGRRRVTAEELAKLAKIYGVESEWLLTGSPKKAGGEKDERIRLAARQLSKLKDKDLDKLMELIHMLKRSGEQE